MDRKKKQLKRKVTIIESFQGKLTAKRIETPEATSLNFSSHVEKYFMSERINTDLSLFLNFSPLQAQLYSVVENHL